MEIDDDVLGKIKACFLREKVHYTGHARQEMRTEPFGRIYETDVMESILNGEIIESYPDDKPYPSFLIFGRTKQNRPLHSVCAYVQVEDRVVVITAYEPDTEKWVNYKERRT